MAPSTRLICACRRHALTQVGPSSRKVVTTSRIPSAKASPTHQTEGESGLTGSEKLLQDAIRLEKQEEELLSQRNKAQDPNDPMWTGEERVQDTVLRMVMDKYKPLRLPSSNPHADPADEKIRSGIQTPSTPSPPFSPSGASGFSRTATDSLVAESATGSFVSPGYNCEHEDGRKLPKTPDQKPWRAVYVRPPSSILGAEEGFTPSIYYGQFLKSHSSSSSPTNPASDIRSKLKAAGLNPSSLPLDDPKAMSKLRSGIKTFERQGKLVRARDSVLDYQLSQSSPSVSSTAGEGKGDELSDVNQNLQLQLGHAQGWDSVVEKRIKAAYEAGLFRENKLRGQPLKRDMDDKNPFLAREEYFMNRIVKRQGAAPPWVGLNMELETELASWRDRLVDAWVRRASRMITTSSTLSAGLKPLEGEVGEGGKEGLKDGERALLNTARRYRDEEWEQRERSFHQHELKRLNELIRRHNHLAPFTARKGLMVLDVELGSMYDRAVPRLVQEISSILRQKLDPGSGGTKDGWDEHLKREREGGGGGVPTYDMWGREVTSRQQKREGEKGSLHGWWGNAVGSRSDAKYGEQASGNARGEGGGRDERVQSLGLVAAIQKSLQWARERIGA